MTTEERTTRTCASCFFTDDFPGVTIEGDARCNYCRDDGFRERIRKLTDSNLDELRRIADQLKKDRKGRYDCIIGASGGLDSSYVLYIAKKVLGLNPLVVSYDSDFRRAIARNNLRTICDRLNVDLKVFKSPGQFDTRYVRSIVRACRDIGAYWGCCSCCGYILSAIVCRYAQEEDISTVLVSRNLYEDGATGYLPRRWKIRFMLDHMPKRNIWKLLRFVYYMVQAQYSFVRFKMEFYVPPLIKTMVNKSTLCALTQTMTSPLMNKMNRVNVTKYVPWDIDTMVAALHDELGWNPPDAPELPMRFDCMIEDGLIDYTYKAATGHTLRSLMCNNLIRAGVRTKAELQDAAAMYNGHVAEENARLLRYLEETVGRPSPSPLESRRRIDTQTAGSGNASGEP